MRSISRWQRCTRMRIINWMWSLINSKSKRPLTSTEGTDWGGGCWLWKMTVMETIIFNPLSPVPPCDNPRSSSPVFPSFSSHSFLLLNVPVQPSSLFLSSVLCLWPPTSYHPSSSMHASLPLLSCHHHIISVILSGPFQINCSKAFSFLSERN